MKAMRHSRAVLPLFFAAMAAVCMLAAAEPDESTLRPYHPSEVVLASDHAETRTQFLLSLGFEVLPLEGLGLKLGPYSLQSLNFAYDGLFDFYLWSRHSQPLISRMQDPGLYFDISAPESDRRWNLERVELGWFHESNGQTIDSLPALNAALAADKANARDQVSRAWDFWHLSSKFSWSPWGPASRLALTPSFRIYTGAQGVVLPAEQDIFWQPQNPPSYIYDYDGLRCALKMEWFFPERALRYLSWGGELKTGYNPDNLGRHWSAKTTLTLKTWNIPWYAYYKNGYADPISDYSTWSDGYGVGVQLW